MISKEMFKLKKNSEPYKDCYCRHPELIENYEKAISDATQTWEVHHRLECCFTQKFLKDMGLYYDVEPEALIFLTKVEHRKIDTACKRISEAKKGKKHSEEHKRKIGESHKNRKDLSKKVLCVETGEVFESTMEAQRKTGVARNSISVVCNGKLKTAGRLHWRFI